jgi:hypothetical protein
MPPTTPSPPLWTPASKRPQTQILISHVPEQRRSPSPPKEPQFSSTIRPQQHDAPPAPRPASPTLPSTSPRTSTGPPPLTVTGAPVRTDHQRHIPFGVRLPDAHADIRDIGVHRTFTASSRSSARLRRPSSHDHDTWQQLAPAWQPTNRPRLIHKHRPRSPLARPPSFARTTPLVPTTVDPPATAAPRAHSAFPAPHPKHRATYPLHVPVHSKHVLRTPIPITASSTTSNAPYPPYNASPAYTANTTSPTFAPSASPSYAFRLG